MVKKEVKPNNIASPQENTYSFTQEELNFLQSRQILINQYRMIESDIDYTMQQFILKNVLTRLNIDPGTHNITYDAIKGTITVKLESPVVVPPKPEIIVPNKV